MFFLVGSPGHLLFISVPPTMHSLSPFSVNSFPIRLQIAVLSSGALLQMADKSFYI